MKAIELIKSFIDAKKGNIKESLNSYNYQVDEFGTISERNYKVYSFFISAKQKSFLQRLLIQENSKVNHTRIGAECIVNGYSFIMSEQYNGSYLFSFDDLGKCLNELIVG